MFWMYILYSLTYHQTYVGHTNDLQHRLYRHNRGEVQSTKRYRQWEMVHTEEFTTRSEAMKRERYFKSGIGRMEVKQFIKRYLLQNGLLHPPKADALTGL
ncbi:MAG: GIY-YIG nuclease family protein [Ignavibacteriales bacterium]|nr:GIY-YIG nuclease family protein [Ignavibacteriales bacterium]